MNNEAATHWHEWTKNRVELTDDIFELVEMWADGVYDMPVSRFDYSYCRRCGKVLL